VVAGGSTAKLVTRVVVLALLSALLEIVAVSQISVFGVSADLTPLIVMSIGLLTGSVSGAAAGFGMGLFLDLALVQTLGLQSLIYTVIGYGAGRLRELRDPQGAIVPIAAGAAATAIATIGYSIVQFLLGVDAPVSFLLVRDIITTIVFNTILAVPVFAIARRWLTPALPDDPARRRRRAYTTGGLSPLSRA
jgi:rod shape-determining protein MreD